MILFSNNFLITIMLCLATVQILHALSSNELKLSGKRKPLLTREDPSDLEEYKRFKRQSMTPMKDYQDFLTNSKMQCAVEMGIDPDDLKKSLLYAEQPTLKEKCLMECILKRLEVMDKKNMLSVAAIGRIANIIGNNNPLITSIAMATAENCKAFITAENSCERAHQISKCIAAEMKMHRIKLVY
ncbi:general odorant-binding protein 19d [Eurosta solidaginis]|uniref:general odorant-binding protein 19d n=1 Tax=Eurosta solidaginis TaxID=178769 RepID=UPI003530F377